MTDRFRGGTASPALLRPLTPQNSHLYKQTTLMNTPSMTDDDAITKFTILHYIKANSSKFWNKQGMSRTTRSCNKTIILSSIPTLYPQRPRNHTLIPQLRHTHSTGNHSTPPTSKKETSRPTLLNHTPTVLDDLILHRDMPDITHSYYRSSKLNVPLSCSLLH